MLLAWAGGRPGGLGQRWADSNGPGHSGLDVLSGSAL